MRWLKSAGRYVGYLVLRGCLVVVPLLPLGLLVWFGRRVGDLIRVLSRHRRRIADKNLRIAFNGELDPRRRAAIAAESFRQFGMFLFECMKFANLADSEARRHVYLDQDTIECLQRLRAMGKGIIFVSAHFGNFELAARAVAMLGSPVVVVVRPARDARTTRLMDALRQRNGMVTVRRDQAAKPMIAALRRGECVALLADQNASEIYVPFFGRPTGTVDGPARLSLHTGAPVVVGKCVRESGLRYHVSIEGLIWPERSAPLHEETRRMTTEMNRLFEKTIRANPEQWLWFHDRWRSSPEVVA